MKAVWFCDISRGRISFILFVRIFIISFYIKFTQDMDLKSDNYEAMLDFGMSVRKVSFEDFRSGLPLKNCVTQYMTFFSSSQNFLKNSEVNPPGPEDLMVLKENNTSLTSSSKRVCISHSFISLVTILGEMIKISGCGELFLVSTEEIFEADHAICFYLYPRNILIYFSVQNF